MESEADEPYQATPKRFNAHAISDLTFRNDRVVCARYTSMFFEVLSLT